MGMRPIFAGFVSKCDAFEYVEDCVRDIAWKDDIAKFMSAADSYLVGEGVLVVGFWKATDGVDNLVALVESSPIGKDYVKRDFKPVYHRKDGNFSMDGSSKYGLVWSAFYYKGLSHVLSIWNTGQQPIPA